MRRSMPLRAASLRRNSASIWMSQSPKSRTSARFGALAEIRHGIGRPRRPVRFHAFLHPAAVAFEHLAGVAPMRGGKFRAHGSQFFLRCFLGENVALDQGGNRSGNHLPRVREQLADCVALFGNVAGFAEKVEQDANFAVHGQTRMADGMDDQKYGRRRRAVDERTGSAVKSSRSSLCYAAFSG